MIKYYLLFLLVLLFHVSSFCQSNIEFIENKGQWDSKVKYMGEVRGGAFFVHQDGFTVVQHDASDFKRLHDSQHGLSNNRPDLKMTLHSHAYRVSFLNSKGATQIVADKPLNTYNNYFISNDPSKWGVNCKVYQGLTLKNVYPNVDVRYYSNSGKLKYDIIVNPGADVNSIALKYEGTNNMEVKDKELLIGTSVGTLKELPPYSYQYRGNEKKETVVKYSLKDNIVRFSVKNYDAKSALIIDPTIIFCSFTGSRVDNWGFCATYGSDGSMFSAGIVFASGFPVHTGAYQVTFSGGSSSGFGAGFDMGIMKLSPDGSNRVYATYLGGTGNELPLSVVTDNIGNLIIAARSNSPDYPVTGSLIGPGGGFDVVLSKLNSSGSVLIGSRRIGGSADDAANISAYSTGNTTSLQQNYGDEAKGEINMDASGNIYLASCTQSIDFPIVGGFQSTNGGGNNKQDGLVLKFSPDLSNLLFSSYLGGTGNDMAYVLSINPSTGNIYVAGGTESTNLPGNTMGTIGSSNHGGIDGFVSIINNNGSSILNTTYIGTSATDQVYALDFDDNGYPYIMGQTTGSWPVINAQWSQINGKQFIAKLQPNLSAFVYSTVFGKGGSTPDICPVAFGVDKCENVYVSGWGDGPNFHTNHLGSFGSMGTAGLTTTPDAIQSVTDDADFYFFILKKDATAQLYGSFFGEAGGQFADHVDGGISHFDKKGVLYQAICGNCYSSGFFPTTPGVWAPNNGTNGQGCNLAMLKINFGFSGPKGNLQSTIGNSVDTVGCVPLTVNFKDAAQSGTKYEWNFGDGTAQAQTTSSTVSHTYTSVGIYRVMMVAIDSSRCLPRDTSYLNIRAGNASAQLSFKKSKQAPCTSNAYQFINLSQAPPQKQFSNTSFTWDFGDGTPYVTTDTSRQTHSFASSGTYIVRLILNDTGYCSKLIFSDTLRVASTIKASFTVSGGGCALNAQFENISQGGSQFKWSFGDGSTATTTNSTHTYSSAGTYTITLITIDSASCNVADSIKTRITVFGKPTANFSFSQPSIINTPVSFTNLSSADAVKFTWKLGDGDSISTTSRNIVQHVYATTKDYNACLLAYNSGSCVDSICKTVTVSATTAVINPDDNFSLNIIPNPGQGIFYLTGHGLLNKNIQIEIFSSDGKKVFNESKTFRTANINEQLNLTAVAAGMYLVRITVDNKIYNRNILKVR